MDYLENGFKIRRWKQCVGSSPTTGTTTTHEVRGCRHRGLDGLPQGVGGALRVDHSPSRPCPMQTIGFALATAPSGVLA